MQRVFVAENKIKSCFPQNLASTENTGDNVCFQLSARERPSPPEETIKETGAKWLLPRFLREEIRSYSSTKSESLFIHPVRNDEIKADGKCL